MRVGFRAAALGVVSSALLAGSLWGTSTALAAPPPFPNMAVLFNAQHVRGVHGLVLVEGRGLVVYTYAGDARGKAGTCTETCATVWPHVRGVPIVAHGVTIHGKFGMVGGQVTFNGQPLYVFAGEKSSQNHADSQFKVVVLPAR